MNTSTTSSPLEPSLLNLVRKLNMSGDDLLSGSVPRSVDGTNLPVIMTDHQNNMTASPGHTTPNSGLPTESREEFFHHLTLKDETVFVALIVMGIIVPAIFISVFALICIRRHKEMKARKAAMLLRDAQDMAMEDYPYMMRGLTRFSPWRI